MSPYKQVNGKKVRDCKYECGTELSWSEKAGIFVEDDGTLHTKERCQQVKEAKKQPIQDTSTQQQQQAKQEFTLESVLKKLEKIGIKVNLEELMKD